MNVHAPQENLRPQQDCVHKRLDDCPEPLDAMPGRLGVPGAALLLLLAAAVLAPGMHVSLIDRDEGWYAQVSREMLASGDWLTPRYLGEVWLAKPPLLYWLVACSFKLLGVGEWQARLIPVAAGSLTVLLTGMLGARLFDRRTGLIAGLLLTTTGLFAIVSKLLLTDGPMLACTMGAILAHWHMRDRPRTGPALVYGLLIGLGVLAKGPATLLFAGAFAAGLLAGGWWAWLASWRYWLWVPVAIGVAAPWYIHIARVAESRLIEQFLWFEIASRIASAPHGHTGPPGYHLVQSLSGLLPWTVFVPGVIVSAWRSRSEPRTRLLLVWCALPWVILELIRSKLPHYILPCYVPLVLLLAGQMSAVWQRREPLLPGRHGGRSRQGGGSLAAEVGSGGPLQPELRADETGRHGGRPLQGGAFLAGQVGDGERAPQEAGGQHAVLRLWPGIMIVVGAVLVIAGLLIPLRPVGLRLALAGGLLVAGFYAVARDLSRRKPAVVLGIAIFATVAFHACLGGLVLPALEPLRLSRQIAEAVNQLTGPDTPVLLCGYDEPSVYFYLDSPGRPVAAADLLDRLARQKGPVVLVMTARARDALPPAAADRLAGWQTQRITGLNYVNMKTVSVQIGLLTPP